MSKLPSIPPNRDGNLTVTKIQELVQIWKGERGSKQDKVVTYADLLKLQLASLNRSGTLGAGTIGVSTPSYTSVPINLTATAGFGLIFLDWDVGVDNYAYTEIYRGTEDNVANAVLIGTSVASLFPDVAVTSGQTYYYWVRAVSDTDNKTLFNSTAGTSATAILEPDYVVDLLEDRISESELAAELLTPIQSIPSIQSTLDNHDVRLPTIEGYVDQLNIDVPIIQTSVSDFATRIPLLESNSSAHDVHLASLDTRVDEIRNIPAFDTNQSYSKDDLVRYGGVTWKALVNLSAPSPTPSEGANWTNIGNYATYDGVMAGDADALSVLDSRVTVNEAGITAHSSDISNLQSSISNSDSNITANANAIAAMDTRVTSAEGTIVAQATDISNIQSDITNATNSISGNATAIDAIDTRVTANETSLSAQASSITAIEASLNDIIVSDFNVNQNYAIDDVFKYNNDFYKVIATQTPPNVTPPNATYYAVTPDYTNLQSEVTANASAIGALDTRVSSAEGTITSHASDITSLENNLTTAQGDIVSNANANSALDTRLTAAEGNISSQSTSITNLQNSLSDAQADIVANSNANTALDSRVTANENDIVGQASSITALQVSVTANADDNDANSSAISATNTAVSNLTTRVTNAEGDIANNAASIVSLNTNIGDAQGDILANSTAISDLNSTTSAQGGQISAANSNIALLQSDITALQNADTATSTAISNLTTRIDSNESDIDSQSTQITSITASINAINGDILTINGNVAANSNALSLLDTRVTASEGNITSMSSDITQLQNDVALLDVDGNAAAINSLDTRVTATENDITSLSSSVSSLSSSVGTNTAAIQTKAEATALASLDGEVQSLKAEYAVKLDVNGYVSGIGLLNDGSSSQMVVASDSVYFIDQGASATPFQPGYNYTSLSALRNTQLVFGYAVVEGQQRFVINVPAYIQDGTITTAQISNATISKAQIADLIVSGAEIADAAITSAKIANTIQSSNFAPGAAGWQINKAGSAIFNDITIYDGQGNVTFKSGSTLIPDLNKVSIRSLTLNPEMTMESAEGKPAGYTTMHNVSDFDWINTSKDSLRVWSTNTSVNSLTGIVSTAFAVVPGGKYRLRLRLRTQAGSGNENVHVAFNTYNSDLPRGKRFICSNNSGDEIVLRDSLSSLGSIQATETYQDFTLEETLSNSTSAKFASVELYAFMLTELHIEVVEVNEVSWEDAGDLAKKDTIDNSTFIADAVIGTTKLVNNTITTLLRSERSSDTSHGAGTWGHITTITIPSHIRNLNEVMPFLVFPFGIIEAYQGAQADAQFRIEYQMSGQSPVELHRGYLYTNIVLGGNKYIQLTDNTIEYVETNGNYGTGWADYGSHPNVLGHSQFEVDLTKTPPFVIEVPAGAVWLRLTLKTSSQYGAAHHHVSRKGSGFAVIGMQR